MTKDLAISRLSTCPHCHRAAVVPWSAASDLLLASSSQTYEYARCAACRVLFLVTRPLESELSKVYPDNYAPYAASQGYSRQPASATLLVRPAYVVLNGLLKRAERFFRRRVDR